MRQYNVVVQTTEKYKSSGFMTFIINMKHRKTSTQEPIQFKLLKYYLLNWNAR